jgi:RNA polymerase sigma-70 factor (ECF subfamily)
VLKILHADYALAKRLLAGDEATFRKLFDEFFPRLYRLALARLDGNREDARDVVQQTFCKAIEHLESYRGEASLYGWMCHICKNTIIDHARQQQRAARQFPPHAAEDTIEAILEAIAAPAVEEPEALAARTDLIGFIQTVLDCLPQRYGDVLEWKYVDELSVNDIAAALSIGPKAAESLLTRAREAFRSAMLAIDETPLCEDISHRTRG